MNITTILQIYKRNKYLDEQIESIRKQTIQSKIIIVHNEGGVRFTYPEGIPVIYANPNLKYHLRFAIGLLCDTEYLAFFDDDTIPGSRWYENCLKTIEKHNCICVSNGRDVNIDTKTQSCPGGWCAPNNDELKCWFGGHTWFMKKDILKYMWYDDIIEKDNGEDIQLSANCMKYGNIPTYIPPHPKNDKELWGSTKGMLLGADENASYINNPYHYHERIKLLDYYIKKGWNPL
jgi:hypothetical protein